MAYPVVRCSSRDLIEAIAEVDVAKVKDLLEAGINVHARDDTEEGFAAVHHVVLADNQEILKLLLDHGAYVDHISHSGIYPLDLAFDLKQVECIKTLLTHEARVDLRLSIHLQEEDVPEEIRELFYQHVNMNERDKLGYTVLLKAVQYKDTRGIQILMKRGANVNVRKLEDGQTSLHIAARQGNLGSIRLLLKHGARPNLKDEFGHTPFHVLIHAPIAQTLKVQATHLLLESGGDVNIGCNMDQVVLHHAVATEGTTRVRKVIIKHIAKLQHKGEHVNEANCELISNNDQLSRFRGRCGKELENIENDIVTGRVKLIEFLSSNEQLTWYTRNIEVEQAFKARQYQRQYPIFYRSLRRIFNISLSKRKLLESAAVELHSVMPQIHSNSIAMDKILGFLSEIELANLVVAGLRKKL